MANVLHAFMPKEERFFDMFKKQSSTILIAAREFSSFVEDFNHLTPEEKNQRLARLEDLEHQCDDITHFVIKVLNKSFITPIDREDIHKLIISLDSIIDCIHGTAQRISLYRINKLGPEISELSKLVEKAVFEVDCAVGAMKKLGPVKHYCVTVHSYENEGDVIHRKLLAKLFNNDKDPVHIIKMKEIYEFFEFSLDRCEEVANIIENIVVKYV